MQNFASAPALSVGKYSKWRHPQVSAMFGSSGCKVGNAKKTGYEKLVDSISY